MFEFQKFYLAICIVEQRSEISNHVAETRRAPSSVPSPPPSSLTITIDNAIDNRPCARVEYFYNDESTKKKKSDGKTWRVVDEDDVGRATSPSRSRSRRHPPPSSSSSSSSPSASPATSLLPAPCAIRETRGDRRSPASSVECRVSSGERRRRVTT